MWREEPRASFGQSFGGIDFSTVPSKQRDLLYPSIQLSWSFFDFLFFGNIILLVHCGIPGTIPNFLSRFFSSLVQLVKQLESIQADLFISSYIGLPHTTPQFWICITDPEDGRKWQFFGVERRI
jgi:hypothetical protein